MCCRMDLCGYALLVYLPMPAKLKISPLFEIYLPECNSLQDFPAVTNAILDAVAEGEISPSEGNAIANGVLAAHQRSFEISSLEQRINAIEEKLSIKGDDE